MRRRAFESFLVEGDQTRVPASPTPDPAVRHFVSVAARAETILNLDLDRMAPTEAGADGVLDRLKALTALHGFTIRQISDFGAALRAYGRFLAASRAEP